MAVYRVNDYGQYGYNMAWSVWVMHHGDGIELLETSSHPEPEIQAKVERGEITSYEMGVIISIKTIKAKGTRTHDELVVKTQD